MPHDETFKIIYVLNSLLQRVYKTDDHAIFAWESLCSFNRYFWKKD